MTLALAPSFVEGEGRLLPRARGSQTENRRRSHRERLLDLAGRVRRLACTGRLDPELIFLAKSDIAHELTRIARELAS